MHLDFRRIRICANVANLKRKKRSDFMKNIVKVYSTETCPFCVLVKNFLKEHKVKFEEIDVNYNQKAAEEMIEKSGQTGVPVLEINGKIIIGFDKEAIKKELKLK